MDGVERVRRPAPDHLTLLARQHQYLVDQEVQVTRRALLAQLSSRGGRAAGQLLDEDFLAVADRPAINQAILAVAITVGGARYCDLQCYDPADRSLHLVAQYGFDATFRTYFETVKPDQATACSAAADRLAPVLVKDIARSPYFTDEETRAQVLASGSRAVSSYPLLDGDQKLLGVLSFHYGQGSGDRGQPALVAWSASLALARAMPGD